MTKIPYCDETLPVVRGCSKISPGCAHCYAERNSLRFKQTTKPWTPANAAENVTLHPELLSKPLRWQRPRTIFVCPTGDLFHEQVPDEFIDRVFATMAICGAGRQTCRAGTRCQHENGVSQGCWHYGDGFDWPTQTFLLLTKRADRMHDYLADADVVQRIHDVGNDPEWSMKWEDPPEMMGELGWPFPNVWLGVTAENQRMADERIALLLKTPAAHRWASIEPALGAVDLGMLKLGKLAGQLGDFTQYLDALKPSHTNGMGFERRIKAGLDWVVVGGESGPGHRPMELGWAKDIVDQCTAARVPVYFKQRAANRPGQPSGVPMLDTAKALPWTP